MRWKVAFCACCSLFFGSRAHSSPPRVLILPTISGEVVSREPRLDDAALSAFSREMGDAAADVFAWRRWSMVSPEESETREKAEASIAPCRTLECAKAQAGSAGATHALFSRLTRTRDGNCTAFLSLYDRVKDEESRTLKEIIAPCAADNLLSSALDLGRRIAEGPRAPVAVTVSLTPLDLRPLDIPDIPDVAEYATTTSTRARKGYPLDRALEIYRTQHMFVFEDETNPRGFYVARDGRLLDECDARRAASAVLTSEIIESCEGNSWEWAWAGVPVGLLVTLLSADSLADGGTFSFSFGLGLSVASAAIATFFNVDASPLEDGVHYSSREEIERMVAQSNATLRRSLDLTEADVRVAGMRK